VDRKTTINIWYAAFALLAIVWLQDLWRETQKVEPLPYSAFVQELKAGNVKEIAVHPDYIEGSLKKPLKDGRERFITTRIETELAQDLSKYDVAFTGVTHSSFFRDLLSWIVPMLIFFAFWRFAIARMAGKEGLGGGFLSIGKSKAKVYVETGVKTTFDDVAGVDEAKEELQEIINFLKDPKRYSRLGARIPKGVLLVGPPGTGKTLLARAVAGEAGVPFFSISGSEFVEMFVGVGAARVRDLFEQARQKAPAIIFIDELDALGRARGAYGIAGHDEKEQTLNQLLAELDGFDTSSGLVLLAATNRPEILDPALLRAGRFDRQVLVDRPDKVGRRQILDVHLKKLSLHMNVDRDQLAALTPGFSGADLANLANEAALLATRRGAEQITMDDFTQAIERIIAGLEKKRRLLTGREREYVAYHEIGHAFVAMSFPDADPVHKVSIIPRGVHALGFTMQRPTEDRYILTQQELKNRITVMLAGRAAEQVVFGHLSTGAADDLVKATSIARSMVIRYGMDPGLQNVAFDDEHPMFLEVQQALPSSSRYSEETAREIDRAVKQIIEEAYRAALQILERARTQLTVAATALMEKETLDEAELRALLRTAK